MKLIKTILGIALLCTTTFSQAEITALDRVAIVVNDGVILKSEIDALVATVKKNAFSNAQELPSDRVLKTQASERLIDKLLKVQMAARMSMRIGDTQLDQTIENIAAEQKITVAQLKKVLEGDGLKFTTYREGIRDELLIGQVERISIRRRINISEQEIDNLVVLLQQHGQNNVTYRVGHILISHNGDQSSTGQATARGKADTVLELLKEQRDFKELAITTSSGPKALEGGDWGYMNINEMPTLFTDAVKGKKKGDIIGPFKSGNGYHIIKVMDIKGQQQVDVTEVNARHILIKTSIILSDERAKAQLEGFIKEIKAGDKTFAELAEKHSEDAGSAIKGGELGWNDPSIWVPAFKFALSQLTAGELSKPFKSTHGWHIIKMIGTRNVDATDKFVKNRAYQMIYGRKFNEENSAWAKELRATAFIEIMD